MSDPTITVTNLGDLGVEVGVRRHLPPQVALVGLRPGDRASGCCTTACSACARVSRRHCLPITGQATATGAAASSPRSTASSRSQSNYEQRRGAPADPADLAPGRTRGRHRRCRTPGETLQEALDLDSIDFLNLVVGLTESTGIEIPERDYPQLSTLDGAVAYLTSHSADEGQK